jgi:hypothetical protein
VILLVLVVGGVALVPALRSYSSPTPKQSGDLQPRKAAELSEAGQAFLKTPEHEAYLAALKAAQEAKEASAAAQEAAESFAAEHPDAPASQVQAAYARAAAAQNAVENAQAALTAAETEAVDKQLQLVNRVRLRWGEQVLQLEEEERQ